MINTNHDDKCYIVSLKGYKTHQLDFNRIDYHYVLEADIMQDVGNGVNLKQAAQARLDNLGQIKSHSCFVNDPKRLKRIQDRMQLAKSMGQVKVVQDEAAKQKADTEMDKLMSLVAPLIRMYQNGEKKTRKFTKDCIRSILVFTFSVDPNKSGKKDEWLRQLDQLVGDDNSGRLNRALRMAAATEEPPTASFPPLLPAPVPAAAAAVPVTAAVPAAAASASSSNAHWLYFRCARARDAMGSPLSPLQICKIVLKVLNKIVREFESGGVDIDDENECD